MMRALFFLVAVALLLFPGGMPAQAQFLKNIFKKESKPVKRPAPRPASGTKPSPAQQKASTPSKGSAAKKKARERHELEPTIFKDRYRIDVLVPMYLNELVIGGKAVYKSHLPDKVLPGLNFYQGIKLAADTLDSYGYSLDVYVHDIADPLKSVEALLAGKKLDSSDLIIGAVPARNVAALAAFARQHSINFVSALSPSDGNIRENYYFNLLQPTLQRHCEVLSKAIARKERNANILVYHRSTVPLDDQCFKLITKDSDFSYAKVLVNTLLPAEKLRNFLDSNADNVIVMPIVDVSYAKRLLEQLNKSFPKFHFEVFGMPSWKGIDLLRREGSLPNVGITISAPFYFDPTTSAGRGFSDTFNRVYGGRPGELAYRGYETLYWYAYLLRRYGTIFNDHYGDSGAAPFTRFDLKLSKDENGKPEYYENNHAYLYRYQGGSFSVAQ